VFSPVDKTSLYLGAQCVLKTTDGGLHWSRISPDLTGSKAPAPAANPVAGAGNPSARNSINAGEKNGPTVDNAIERGYGSLSTVAPSYVDKDVLWAGSDTGVISVTRDGGKTWANVTPPGMRPWTKISLIDPSHFGAGVAYASAERHRVEDRAPYIYRTEDYGKTWKAITAGLETPDFVNAVREDPKRKGLLYAGTEFGVYFSTDDGDYWQPLQLNLPITSIRDLVVHGDDLVIATHGRSFWILDDITPLRQLTETRRAAAFLYRPETAVRVDNDGFPGTPLPPEEPIAKNPPDGAILDYYLPAEAHEVSIRIFDAHHQLVRHISSTKEKDADHRPMPIAERWFPKPHQLETTAGMHRIIWNLAWGSTGVTESDEPDDGEGDIPRGPRAAPGAYTVELEADGKKLPEQTLTVAKDPRSPVSQAGFDEKFETSYKIFRDSLESRRALAEIGSVKERLDKIIASADKAEGGAHSKEDPVTSHARELAATINALVEGSDGTLLGLESANQELTSVLSVAESSDRAMPAQALEVYEEARTAAGQRIKEWAALKKGPIEKLNEQLKVQGLEPIAIAEIEREVYFLMTR
jgi:photosystem II stability/assembly factor-like uncharacterized protein